VGYQVVNEFIEKEHKDVLYKSGEVYPKEGYEAEPERVAFLQSDKNKYKRAFLGPELEDAEKTVTKKAETASNEPKDKGNAKPSESEKDAKKGTTKKKTSTKK
jgi:hypothetical protein